MNSRAVFLFMLAVPVSAVLLPGCASSRGAFPTESLADTATITGSSATLIVHGMSCPLCASNVDTQLLTVPGVVSANVNMGSGEVRVGFAPGARVTRAQLAKAVDDSGFSLVEVRIP
ncbi:MAG: heavy-metal-associated domain-containing protein [Phycisphaerae bacterium]|nr:heavy-metal-associated domain-containing protein [Phycisphaerae bacterium]